MQEVLRLKRISKLSLIISECLLFFKKDVLNELYPKLYPQVKNKISYVVDGSEEIWLGGKRRKRDEEEINFP